MGQTRPDQGTVYGSVLAEVFSSGWR